MNILVVEDEAIVGLDICRKLEAAGYTVDALLDNGEDALLQADRQLPDLVLMDICLKGRLDGVQTAGFLRKIAPVPLIFLTALADRKTIDRAREVDPHAYLVKPFKDADLYIAIDMALYKAEKKKATEAPAPVALYPVNNCLFVRSGNAFERLEREDVYYLEASRAYCTVYTRTRHYLLSEPLSEVLRKWGSKNMVRIHKSHAVNLCNLSRIEENCVWIDKKSLPIGAHYRDSFRASVTMI